MTETHSVKASIVPSFEIPTDHSSPMGSSITAYRFVYFDTREEVGEIRPHKDFRRFTRRDSLTGRLGDVVRGLWWFSKASGKGFKVSGSN